MKKRLALTTLLLICSFTQSVTANEQTPGPRWDRSSAMASVRSVNIDVAVYELGDISSLADGKATLSKLEYLETRPDWPLPAREAAIYQFTRSLAELPRDAVATQVMQHLHNYQAQTLVPHEDHDDALIPLFNIRAAAAGVENGWQRKEFAIRATQLIEKNPTALVSAYAESTNHNQRSAYLDALQDAELADVETIQAITLERLGESPGLTPMLGVSTVITADTFAIQKLLINGRGAQLSPALVQLDNRLQASETATLLVFAIEEAPAANATLAIAAWWPRLRHESAIRDLLINLLADPALGASASLALAQNSDVQTIKLLQDTANGSSTAARRAQMALDFNRDRLTGELQP
jgi:hypothetical protein